MVQTKTLHSKNILKNKKIIIPPAISCKGVCCVGVRLLVVLLAFAWLESSELKHRAKRGRTMLTLEARSEDWLAKCLIFKFVVLCLS